MPPPEGPALATATIVMCTFNGALFLREQLKSFCTQQGVRWRLFVSDDGSTDETRKIIQQFQKSEAGRIVVDTTNGPRRGFASNFLTALGAAPESEYFALSDQDDIWLPEKLQRAISLLSLIPADRPTLYCSRTTTANRQGEPVGYSELFTVKPNFKNAIVQSISGGNTMVLNLAARKLVQQAGTHLNIVSHDWWLYQLVSGAGGAVIYDTESHILYRQHGENMVGENRSIGARLNRLKRLMNGVFKTWMDRNLSALDSCKAVLTVENRDLVTELTNLRRRGRLARVIGIYKLRLRRDSILENIGLVIAAAMGRF